LLFATPGMAAPDTQDLFSAYLGSAACAACHEDAARAWTGSHHDLAMQKPTEATVLGDFDNARFEHFDSVTEFFRRDDRFVVRTEGADGERRDFEVAWVFGVYPLQQYLLPTDGRRLQALSVAWDSRSADEGGQRWFHLYPDEPIPHDDPLHWTGPYQNWNVRCAECHSTDFRKAFDATADRYSSTFFEEDVGCEACHGPGRRHAELMGAGREGEVAREGLSVDLAARGRWSFAEGSDIARRESPLTGQAQIDGCARCHARRSTLGDYRFDRPLSDTHRLALLGAPLYHPDGQILDEVYVYGSFVQSKMHRAGVVCSNCHEPHSNALRAPGNGVCAQCHKASVFDAETHHHHAAGSDGAQCVNCHMPARTYMGVDDRRDHSMRVPRPDLSVALGTPNACTACHDDETADWAVDALRAWGTPPRGDDQDPAAAMAAAERGDRSVAPRLAALAGNASEAAIWRATALEQAAGLGSPEALRLAETLLASPDPLLRVSAVRALQALPLPERYARLAPLAQDSVSGVRLEVAAQLAGVPLDRVSAARREELLTLFDEFRGVHREHADMPSMNLQLGLFHLARGDRPAAETAYRRALEINPQLAAARLNLADLLRAGGRDDEARGQLEEALATNPRSADAMHALGLLEIRAGNREAALDWLAKAATSDAASPRHRYVYGIAQHDTGDLEAALRTLQALHRDLPGDEDALLALVNYSVEAGDRPAARRYADRLVALAPQNSDYQRLRASLR
jgi:predicted CXXCH cytochrome family protein